MDPPEHRRFRHVRVPIEQPHPDQMLIPEAADSPAEDDTIQTAFEKFDRENPHVFEKLTNLALEWYGAGHARCSIGMLFEVLRWQTGTSTIHDPEGYVLNNNYRSRYARKIMTVYPELDDFFETRELTS